jgi:uncharacterized membrane protein YgdD (TMEM256/DUF423 family)
LKQAFLGMIIIAALQGAAGIALAAAAAHVEGAANLGVASQFLLFHAGAGLGLASLARQPLGRAKWLSGAAFVLQASVTLFSSDLVSRVYLESRLFPYAAPIGGSLTILSWLALAGWATAELVAPSRYAKTSNPCA